MSFAEIVRDAAASSGFASLTLSQIVMLLLCFVLFYLAIVKKFEPLLLVPIAFGILLANLPNTGLMNDATAAAAQQLTAAQEALAGGTGTIEAVNEATAALAGVHWYDSGILRILYSGVKSSIFPCLIFLGIGAMTDFSPLLSNPVSLLLGAGAQLGIYVAFVAANGLGSLFSVNGSPLFTAAQAAAIAIIGGADGPTAIFLASLIAPELLGPIAVAAYSYMALIPLIQPPLMRMMTTEKERRIKMKQLRTVSKTERVIFPILVTVLCVLLLPSVAPLIGMLMLGNLVRGEGAARVSMIGSIIGQVVNIVLDPIFILNKGDKLFGLAMPFGTGQGVAGAAIATVIGNVVSVVFFLIYFLRGKSILSISPGRYRVRGGIARGVITVGLPAAINSLLMSISNMLINVFLQAYGDNAVAAMGITMKANMLVVMLQLGLAQGIQPLVGYCYGANNLDRMRHSIRFSCVCNIVLGTVITVIYFIFTRQVVSVFIDDPAVIDYGVKMLRALMISGPVIGCMFVLNFSFQGMGKGTQSMILSLSRQGLIYFPLLIIMNKTVGLDGIIWSQAVADLVCTAMSVVMFLLVVRKLRRQHSQKTKA